MKNLFLFDLDGTLAKSTQKIDSNMINILKNLSINNDISIVSGGTYDKIKYQIDPENENIFCNIFAENGIMTYHNNKLISTDTIKNRLTEKQLQYVINLCLKYILELELPHKRGGFINFRNSIIYVSPSGHDVTLDERNTFAEYDKVYNIRKNMIKYLKKNIPISYNLDIKLGGQIGIAIRPMDWDKCYCLQFINTKKYNNIYFFGGQF